MGLLYSVGTNQALIGSCSQEPNQCLTRIYLISLTSARSGPDR